MNSVSSVFALKIPTSRREFKYTDAALIQQKRKKKKQIEWNVGHFMHPMVTALLTLDEYIYISKIANDTPVDKTSYKW